MKSRRIACDMKYDCLPWHKVMFDEERRKDDGRRMNLRSLRTDNE